MTRLQPDIAQQPSSPFIFHQDHLLQRDEEGVPGILKKKLDEAGSSETLVSQKMGDRRGFLKHHYLHLEERVLPTVLAADDGRLDEGGGVHRHRSGSCHHRSQQHP